MKKSITVFLAVVGLLFFVLYCDARLADGAADSKNIAVSGKASKSVVDLEATAHGYCDMDDDAVSGKKNVKRHGDNISYELEDKYGDVYMALNKARIGRYSICAVNAYLPDMSVSFLEVKRDGKTVFLNKSGEKLAGSDVHSSDFSKFWIFNEADEDDDDEMALPLPGTDLNGDGIADFVLGVYTMGLHCCYYFTIFSLGDSLEILGAIEGIHSSLSLEDVDSDGKYEARVTDWTFAYWPRSFAGSPRASVILRFDGKKLKLAADLMRERMDTDEFDKKVAASRAAVQAYLKEGLDDGTVAWLWIEDYGDYVLKLLYNGNEAFAWKFFEEALVISKEEKALFVAEFRELLNKSPYWPQLQAMEK